jgi:hypothetical protein
LSGTLNNPTAGDEIVDAQVFGESGNKRDCFGVEVDSDRNIARASVVGGDIDTNVNATGRNKKDECANEGKQATNRHEVEDSCW